MWSPLSTQESKQRKGWAGPEPSLATGSLCELVSSPAGHPESPVHCEGDWLQADRQDSHAILQTVPNTWCHPAGSPQGRCLPCGPRQGPWAVTERAQLLEESGGSRPSSGAALPHPTCALECDHHQELSQQEGRRQPSVPTSVNFRLGTTGWGPQALTGVPHPLAEGSSPGI